MRQSVGKGTASMSFKRTKAKHYETQGTGPMHGTVASLKTRSHSGKRENLVSRPLHIALATQRRVGRGGVRLLLFKRINDAAADKIRDLCSEPRAQLV